MPPVDAPHTSPESHVNQSSGQNGAQSPFKPIELLSEPKTPSTSQSSSDSSFTGRLAGALGEQFPDMREFLQGFRDGFASGDRPDTNTKKAPNQHLDLTPLPGGKTFEPGANGPKTSPDTTRGGLIRTGGDVTANPDPGSHSEGGDRQMPRPTHVPPSDTKPTMKDKTETGHGTICYENGNALGSAVHSMFAPHRPPEGGEKSDVKKASDAVMKGKTPQGEKIDKMKQSIDQLPDGALKDFFNASFDMMQSGKLDEAGRANLARLAQDARKEFEKFGNYQNTKEQLDAISNQLKNDFGLSVSFNKNSVTITNAGSADVATSVIVTDKGDVSGVKVSGGKVEGLDVAKAAHDLGVTADEFASGRRQFKSESKVPMDQGTRQIPRPDGPIKVYWDAKKRESADPQEK